MGWKFTATSSTMVPKKFWGISRRSIQSCMKMDTTNEETSTANDSNQDEENQLRLVY